MSLQDILNNKHHHQRNHSDIYTPQKSQNPSAFQTAQKKRHISNGDVVASAVFQTPQHHSNKLDNNDYQFSNQRRNSNQPFEISSANSYNNSLQKQIVQPSNSDRSLKLPKILTMDQRSNNNLILNKWKEPQGYDSLLMQAEEQLKKKGRSFNQPQSMSAMNSPIPTKKQRDMNSNYQSQSATKKNTDFLNKMMNMYSNTKKDEVQENTSNLNQYQQQNMQQQPQQHSNKRNIIFKNFSSQQSIEDKEKDSNSDQDKQQKILNSIKQQSVQQQFNKSQNTFNILLKKGLDTNNNILNRLDQRQDKFINQNQSVLEQPKASCIAALQAGAVGAGNLKTEGNQDENVESIQLLRKKRTKVKPSSLVYANVNPKQLQHQSSNEQSDTSIIRDRDASISSIKSCLKNKSQTNISDISFQDKIRDNTPKKREKLKKSVFFDHKMKVIDPVNGKQEITTVRDNQKKPSKQSQAYQFFTNSKAVHIQQSQSVF